MRNKHELFAKDQAFRIIGVWHPDIGAPGYTIHYSWGRIDGSLADTERSVYLFGIKTTGNGFSGYGSEQWHRNLTLEQAQVKLDKIRKSVDKAGFKSLGIYSL